jgi:hypothetical protein
MDQYCVIQNFRSSLAARAFLCHDYQKCFLTILSRRHSKSSLTGQFLALLLLSDDTFVDFSSDFKNDEKRLTSINFNLMNFRDLLYFPFLSMQIYDCSVADRPNITIWCS